MKCSICKKEVKFLNGHYKNAIKGICNSCLEKEGEMRKVMWENKKLKRLKEIGNFKEKLSKNPVLEEKKSEKDIDIEIENRIHEAFKNNRMPSVNELMGIYMLKFRGKIDGKKVREMVESILAKAKEIKSGK